MNLGGASTTRWRDAYWFRPNISPSGEYPNDDSFETHSGVNDWVTELGSPGVETYMTRPHSMAAFENHPSFYYLTPEWDNTMTVRYTFWDGSQYPLIYGPGKSPVQSMVELYELEVYFPSGGTAMVGGGIGLWSGRGPGMFGEFPTESGIDYGVGLNAAQIVIYHRPGLDVHGDPYDDFTEDEWHNVRLMLEGYLYLHAWVDGEYQGRGIMAGYGGPEVSPPSISGTQDNSVRDTTGIPNFIVFSESQSSVGFESRIRGLRVRAMDMNWPTWPQGES